MRLYEDFGFDCTYKRTDINAVLSKNTVADGKTCGESVLTVVLFATGPLIAIQYAYHVNFVTEMFSELTNHPGKDKGIFKLKTN